MCNFLTIVTRKQIDTDLKVKFLHDNNILIQEITLTVKNRCQERWYYQILIGGCSCEILALDNEDKESIGKINQLLSSCIFESELILFACEDDGIEDVATNIQTMISNAENTLNMSIDKFSDVFPKYLLFETVYRLVGKQ